MDMTAEILKPLAVLAAWTMVMWVWMYATRLPAMTAAKLDPDELVRQGGKTLDQLLPA
jgi:ABC-type lipoprotein release transport system permease subunit